jgi:hypothetical protein
VDRLLYGVNDRFFTLISQLSNDVESLLVADHGPTDSPRRLFLVRYVVTGGASGESNRPIFKNELTGYDCEVETDYPTQKADLERLQSVMESSMFGHSEVLVTRAKVHNTRTGREATVKVLVSKGLVAELVDLYQFAW